MQGTIHILDLKLTRIFGIPLPPFIPIQFVMKEPEGRELVIDTHSGMVVSIAVQPPSDQGHIDCRPDHERGS